MKENGTRSFKPVGSQVRFDRSRRRKKRTAIIWAIAAVSLAITVFAFLIFAELFGWFEKSPEGPGEEGGENNGKLEFEEILVSSDEKHVGDLILINSSFPFVFPETAPELFDIYSNRTLHEYVNDAGEQKKVYAYYPQSAQNCAKYDRITLDALNALADDFYKATGDINLFIYDEDGYRSQSAQEGYYAKDSVNYVPAGQSEHHTGKALDLYTYSGTGSIAGISPSSVYKWIYDNAYKYGFIHRYPEAKANITGITTKYEAYHFRYVGYAHAYYMYQNGLCLEEYLDLIRDSHSYADGALEFVGDDGNQYSVYYVAASSDPVTRVPVPKTSDKISYSISGDNKEGFIVTVIEEK